MKKTVGDLLREARNKKGLALQTIERSTGIATHHLLAMELDQFSLIDADQLDSHLQAYAKAVGLDYAVLESYYAEQTSQAALPTPELSFTTSFDALAAETHEDYSPEPLPSRSSRRYSRSDRGKKAARSTTTERSTAKKGQSTLASTLAKVVLWLILLGLLAFGGWTLYQKYFANQGATAAPSSATSAVEEVNASTSTLESSSEVPASGAQLTVSGGGETIEVAVANAQQPLNVEISLSGAESSWVSLTNSDLGAGGITLSATQPTYTATLFEGATEALMTMGVSQGVTVKVDGQVVDTSGLTPGITNYIILKVQ